MGITFSGVSLWVIRRIAFASIASNEKKKWNEMRKGYHLRGRHNSKIIINAAIRLSIKNDDNFSTSKPKSKCNLLSFLSFWNSRLNLRRKNWKRKQGKKKSKEDCKKMHGPGKAQNVQLMLRRRSVGHSDVFPSFLRDGSEWTVVTACKSVSLHGSPALIAKLSGNVRKINSIASDNEYIWMWRLLNGER